MLVNTRPSLTVLFCSLLAATGLSAGDKNAVKLNTDVFPYNLSIGGTSTLPQIFFFNTDKGDFTYLRPQVEMAAKAGVHIYSFPLMVHMKPPTDEPDFTHAEKLLEKFIAIDPQAKFLVRLVLGPTWSWKAYNKKNDANVGEYFTYADGTTSRWVSFASDAFLDPTSVQLRKIVRHFEAKYPDRMLVYQVAPVLSEMFDVSYRQKGPDYSAANTMAFRRYLRERYGDAAGLRKAWGDDKVDFGSAQVPMPEQGRFPMTHVTGRRISAFYKPVEERAWIDYSEFYSKLISGHVIRWCRIVKEETSGNKMTAAFYGYLFTLPGSFAGHFNLAEVLDSEYVDILCSPVSYVDRAPGGPGSFMTPVDSVILHRKLWINEDDTRTHVIDVERHGRKPGFGATTAIDETIGVIDRNISNILAHGCGIWWMDLGASGAYNSPEVWDLIKERQAFFRRSEERRKSYSADVQLIVDEKSKMYFASDYSFSRSVFQRAITSLGRSSATVESYLLSDYVAGRTQKARMVVFATTFKVSAEQMSAVQKRLAKDKSHRVWCFLPGYIDGEGKYDTAHVEELTGFSIKLVPGRVASTGTYGSFADVRLVEVYDNLDLEERPVVSSEGCTIIGTYDSDGMASCAMKSARGIHSFYIGSPGSTVGLFRSIFETAAVHMWADRPAVVTRNSNYLSVYTGEKGKLTLHIPDGIEIRTTDGETLRKKPSTLPLNLDGTGIQWFEYTNRRSLWARIRQVFRRR